MKIPIFCKIEKLFRILKTKIGCRYYSKDIYNVVKDLERFGINIDDKIIFEDLNIFNSYKQLPIVIKENFIYQIYNFISQNNESYVCIDIGANVGISSLYLAKKDFISKIYAFEPLKPTFGFFLENLENNKILSSKIEAFNFGLGDKNDVLKVHYNKDHMMSVSSNAIFDSCFERYSIEEITIKNVSEVIKPILEKHKEEKFFIKIDCEGAEYQIIPALYESGMLNHIDVIITEFHGQAPTRLLEILKNAGFFSFCEWTRKDDWEIGIIKSIRSINTYTE